MKVYVWTLPTRIFHALLVLFTLGAFISAEWEDLLNVHASLGISLGVLILFRIVWGFMGPKYSRFKDFALSITALKAYLFSLLDPKKVYAGHNPAASFAMIGMIIVLFLLTLTGLLTYGIQENRGVFAFLHESFFKDMELFEEVHEFLSTLLWFLIAAHVGGVLFDRLLHAQTGTLRSIFNGYKNIEAQSVSLNIFQKLVAAIGIGISIFVLVYALSGNSNLVTVAHNQPVNYEKVHPLFYNECASCHTLYPPALLPKKSWRFLMADLENHFGDDASLEQEEEQSILTYLLNNSAEDSTMEASVKILKTFPNKDIIAVTQTPFWEKTHKGIDEAAFKSDKIKSKANCKACHSDVERGLIEDSNIKMPKLGS